MFVHPVHLSLSGRSTAKPEIMRAGVFSGGRSSNSVDTLLNYCYFSFNMQDAHGRLLFLHQGECCGCSPFDHNAMQSLFFFPIAEAMVKITLVKCQKAARSAPTAPPPLILQIRSDV